MKKIFPVHPVPRFLSGRLSAGDRANGRAGRTGSEEGAVAIVLSAAMFVILGFLVLVVDGGRLYATKNKYQNAVEAAAMAGAIHMCGSDPVLVAREIARANGIPHSEDEGLVVALGFYDEHGIYEDFSEYKDFVEDPFPDTSRNEAVLPTAAGPAHNNAVLVSLSVEVESILALLFGYRSVPVSANAVAYLERYLMISLQDEGDGISTDSKSWDWIHGGGNTNPDQPEFHNGDLRSDSDIRFFSGKTSAGPSFLNSRPYAHGEVRPKGFGTDRVSKLDLPPTNWDALRDAAEIHGKRIDRMFFQNLPQSNTALRTGVDHYGNCYRCNLDGTNPFFCPRPGDHEGRTYYVTGDVGETLWIGSVQCAQMYSEEYRVTNLTLAFEGGSLGFNHDLPRIIWGGEETADLVRFYAGGDLMLGGVTAYEWASDSGNVFEGVFFHADREFGYRPSGAFGQKSAPEIRSLRVLAGERIILGGYEGYVGHQDRYAVGFDANFGPPCPATVVRLGQLESTWKE